MLKTCFVIQRFDGGVYDRRYRETFAPAIEIAGAKPVRADEVLGTVPVIEKIESGLKEATVAFADASEDNANVFLEIGYALALNVPTVIVCDKAKRTRLPFDISHRPVVFYSTEAQSDFEKLSEHITLNIRAALVEQEQRQLTKGTEARVTSEPDGLDEVKRLCLLEILDQDLRSPGGSSLWTVQKSVVRPFVSERMVALAIASLVEDQLVQRNDRFDGQTDESWVAFSLTEEGRKYLLRSYSALMASELEDLRTGKVDLEDDVPF